MIAVTDVHYRDEDAVAALVVAADWGDGAAVRERIVPVAAAAPYEPGAFYRRELPALLAVLDGVELAPDAAVLIDGYVWLGEGREGLGAHLWRALGERWPVVGVAKTRFQGAPAIEVRRGASARPLFVTAAGVSAEEVAARVAGMHGVHRVPTLITRADQLARGVVAAAGPLSSA